VCLISDEHSARLVWKIEENRQIDEEDDGMDSFGDRRFRFTVEQTNAEEEGAIEEEGFIASTGKVNVVTLTHVQAGSTCLHKPSHSASC
jgi:hypothetical protein